MSWTPASAQSILSGFVTPQSVGAGRVGSVLFIDDVLSTTSIMCSGGSAPLFALASAVAVSVTELKGPNKLPKISGTVACCCTSMAL